MSDLPTEFVTKNIPLHGHIAEVRPDNTLGVRHIPLLQGIWGRYFFPWRLVDKLEKSENSLVSALVWQH